MIKIEIKTDNGHLKAVDDVYKKELKEYLIMHFRESLFKTNLWKELDEGDSISILKSIQVEKEFQHKGVGTKLMLEYLNKINSDWVVLIADESRSGRTLPNFYKKFGFEIVVDEINPIMIRKNLG